MCAITPEKSYDKETQQQEAVSRGTHRVMTDVLFLRLSQRACMALLASRVLESAELVLRLVSVLDRRQVAKLDHKQIGSQDFGSGSRPSTS